MRKKRAEAAAMPRDTADARPRDPAGTTSQADLGHAHQAGLRSRSAGVSEAWRRDEGVGPQAVSMFPWDLRRRCQANQLGDRSVRNFRHGAYASSRSSLTCRKASAMSATCAGNNQPHRQSVGWAHHEEKTIVVLVIFYETHRDKIVPAKDNRAASFRTVGWPFRFRRACGKQPCDLTDNIERGDLKLKAYGRSLNLCPPSLCTRQSFVKGDFPRPTRAVGQQPESSCLRLAWRVRFLYCGHRLSPPFYFTIDHSFRLAQQVAIHTSTRKYSLPPSSWTSQ